MLLSGSLASSRSIARYSDFPVSPSNAALFSKSRATLLIVVHLPGMRMSLIADARQSRSLTRRRLALVAARLLAVRWRSHLLRYWRFDLARLALVSSGVSLPGVTRFRNCSGGMVTNCPLRLYV